MEQKPALAKQYYFSAIVSLGGFLLGTIIGWSSQAHIVVVRQLSISDEEFSWIASIMPLGGAFSQVLTFVLLSFMGRKTVIYTLAVLNLFGWSLLSLSKSYALYVTSRFLLGLFSAGFCVSVPLFIGEISHKSIRGFLGVWFQLFIVIGICYSYAFAYVRNLYIFNLTCIVITVIMGTLVSFAKESPVYLYKKNKIPEATKSLQYYRGKEYNIDFELSEIATFAKPEDTTFWQSFKQKSSIKATIMLFVLCTIQQLSGINTIMFYAHPIFEMSKTNIDQKVSAIILGGVQIVMTGVAAGTIDRVGRKILWYISLAVMTVCLLTLGFYFTCRSKDEEFAAKLGLLPTLSICLYIAGFSIGCGPLPWVMVGEVLPMRVKPIVGTVAAFINWMLAFVVTVSFPVLVKAIGPDWVFYIYGIITGLSIIFIVFCVYETKNKSLKEIQAMLEGN